MKKTIVLIIICFFSISVLAQTNYTISGTIIDQETKLPLQGASVFAENTTLGTATDNNGIFNLKLPNGGYSLVISFTGYQTETKRITTTDASAEHLIIDLKKKEKSLDEFVVKASYEVADGLAKYGDFFLENFIGKTANSKMCFIKNTDALKFYYYKRSKRLKILATQPLEIINNALGYTIQYQLDSFVHEYNTDVSIYTGYPLFKEMETSILEQLEKWSSARKEAYNGSILHFMRSMYDKKLKEEGFEIQFVVKHNENETGLVLNDFYRAVNYKKDDSTNTVDILPNQKEVAIIYKNEEPSTLYAEAYPDEPKKFELSVISFLPQETLDIEQNGFYYEQNDITITGYLAWEKVGDMLPYDFKENKTNSFTSQHNSDTVISQKATEIKDTEVVKAADTVTNVTKIVVADKPDAVSFLDEFTWKMEESRVIEGDKMFNYKRGNNNNSINFDNDFYKFNPNNTGTYFFNGQQYNFSWKYMDKEKTKIEMQILYPTPLIVNLENITLSATSFRYTRLQKVNGINIVAIESRTIK